LLADRLALAAKSALAERELDAEIEVVELRDLAIDITNNLLTGFPPPALRAAIDAVTGADALIAVTPVFTAGYSGLFKSFFDILDTDALAGKPVLIGATGGTERHSLVLDYQMRPMLAYLRAEPVPTGVYAASADWGSTEQGGLHGRVQRAAGELADRVAGRAPQATEAEVVVPFEKLLFG
jgi:FMN reductase